MIEGGDDSAQLMASVAEAAAAGQALYISAGGSKREWLGRHCEAPVLDVSSHSGIVDYQPAELVITARAGTPLVQLLEVLEQQGQTLPCEPPLFDGRATLGGTLACNLSGPARPWQGSIRDLVLGVQLINGKGELLNFGGRVMKNVAGYDVSRLQAGALGTLGVLSQVSLKVLPKTQYSLSLMFQMNAQQAIDTMNRHAGKPGPLSGACWVDGQLYLRLSGTRGAVEHTADAWGGDRMAGGDLFWGELRDLTLPFFAGSAPLWRFSVKPTAPPREFGDALLIDWGGAQRWLRGDYELEQLQRTASTAGGNVTLVRGGDRRGELRPQAPAAAMRLQQQLKHAFDPLGVLNPGRLYSWL